MSTVDFDIEKYSPPTDRKYTPDHEWALLEPDGRVRIGITDYATGELGDVVYFDPPLVGAVLKQFDPMAEVESVKAVSPIFAPVSGEVVEVNAVLKDEARFINEDPFGEGWMVIAEKVDPKELEELMDAPTYIEHIRKLLVELTH